MDQEKKQAIALMRYSAIAPLITGLSDDYKSLTAFFNNASVKGVIHPDGTIKHYAPGTIEKWYRNYKEGGFDGNRFISGYKKAPVVIVTTETLQNR